MTSATETIANAASAAVAAGSLESEHAQRLMGCLLFDAMGIEPTANDNGNGSGWRQELIALGVSPALIATARAERGVVSLQRAAPALPSVAEPNRASPDGSERVLAHIALLGDPARWETATTYASLALGLMDAVWSIGVRYTGVLNVLHRYRAARRGAGADPDRDTPADLIAFIGSCGGPDTFAAAVNNRQRTSSRNGILKADAVLRVAQVWPIRERPCVPGAGEGSLDGRRDDDWSCTHDRPGRKPLVSYGACRSISRREAADLVVGGGEQWRCATCG